MGMRDRAEKHYKHTRIPTDDRHERRTGALVVPISVTRIEPLYQPGTVTEGTTTLFGGSGGIGERTKNFESQPVNKTFEITWQRRDHDLGDSNRCQRFPPSQQQQGSPHRWWLRLRLS